MLQSDQAHSTIKVHCSISCDAQQEELQCCRQLAVHLEWCCPCTAQQQQQQGRAMERPKCIHLGAQ